MKYVLRILAVIGTTILIALIGLVVAAVLVFKGPYERIRVPATEYLENISFASWVPTLMLSTDDYEKISAQISGAAGSGSSVYSNDDDISKYSEDGSGETISYNWDEEEEDEDENIYMNDDGNEYYEEGDDYAVEDNDIDYADDDIGIADEDYIDDDMGIADEDYIDDGMGIDDENYADEDYGDADDMDE